MYLEEGELGHGIATKVSGDVREQKKELLKRMYRYIKAHPEKVEGRQVYFKSGIFPGGIWGYGLDEVAVVAHFFKRRTE